MGLIDKAKNKAEELKGEVKERAGGASGDDQMRREGKTDQTSAKGKQAGENVKDAGRNLKDGLSS